ncbi:MAG: major facilitator superfamily domain-containing protein [Linnemannia elongata]|nr:MAG: major facilitator superfamily domain-containing protein [Linnemannia elongata]
MMSMAAVKTPAGLLASRFFLGLTESGLFPGSVYLISLWYTRAEQALRNGLFFSTATMAGAFGGVLAYGIAQMEGVAGLHGWQWIFILEGLPTVLLTVVVYFFLPDFPSTAPFLSTEEKDLAVRRLLIDAGPATETAFSWRQFRAVFVDWKVYMHMITYILNATPLYSLSLFLPSIVQGFKFNALTTQAMTAPAYIIACLFTILFAFSSDRFRERGIHYAFPTFIGGIGYILLIVTKDSSTVSRYISLTVTASGVFASVPAMLSWFTTNIGGHTKRGVATAAIISFGNIGGAIGGQIYRAEDQLNGYVRGHTICAVSSKCNVKKGEGVSGAMLKLFEWRKSVKEYKKGGTRREIEKKMDQAANHALLLSFPLSL